MNALGLGKTKTCKCWGCTLFGKQGSCGCYTCSGCGFESLEPLERQERIDDEPLCHLCLECILAQEEQRARAHREGERITVHVGDGKDIESVCRDGKWIVERTLFRNAS